jgi:hypothetical protein
VTPAGSQPVVIRLPDAPDVPARVNAGVVVRETDDRGRGIELTDVGEGDRERIVRFVHDRRRAHQRLRLRRLG